jgi:hypothetical protein
MLEPLTYTNAVSITTAGITAMFNALHNPNNGAAGITAEVTPIGNEAGDRIIVRILPGDTLPLKVKQAKPTGASIIGLL